MAYSLWSGSQSLHHGSQGHVCTHCLSHLLLSHCSLCPYLLPCQLSNMPSTLFGPWCLSLSLEYNSLQYSHGHSSHFCMSLLKCHSLSEAFPNHSVKNSNILPIPSLLTTLCLFSFLHSIYTIYGLLICLLSVFLQQNIISMSTRIFISFVHGFTSSSWNSPDT